MTTKERVDLRLPRDLLVRVRLSAAIEHLSVPEWIRHHCDEIAMSTELFRDVRRSLPRGAQP